MCQNNPSMMNRRPDFTASILIALLALAPCFGQARSASAANIAGPGDYALRVRLVDRLSRDPDLTQERFDIVLVNGGAVFSGKISSFALRLKVLRIAGFIRGIVNVTDEFIIERADVSDEALRDAVVAVLSDNTVALELKDLGVEVEDAIVTLRGSVRRFPQRNQAEAMAGSVLGVTRVINRMTSLDVPDRSKHPALTDATVAYLMDYRAFPHLGQIDVAAEDGVVTLTGRVTFFHIRRQAAVMVGLIEGVTRVDNRLKVDPGLSLSRPQVKALK